MGIAISCFGEQSSPNTNGLPKVIKGHHIESDLEPVLISFEETCEILQNELHVPILEKGKPAVAFDRILPSLCAVQHQKKILVKNIKEKAIV